MTSLSPACLPRTSASLLARKPLGALLLALGLAGSAVAHTPYLLPTTFSVTRPQVSLQAAISDELFFLPEGPVRSDFYEIAPNGARSKLDKVTVLKDFSVIEADIPENGTYKLVTGDEGVRVMPFAKVDGRWLMVRSAAPAGSGDGPPRAAGARASGNVAGEGSPSGAGERAPGNAAGGAARPPGPPRFIEAAAVPADAERFEARSFARLETYVTKGAPSPGALAVTGQGFELRPLTHPNEIFIDQGFRFEALADGKPVAGQAFTVFRAGNAYDDRKVYAEVTSGVDGRVALSFDRPGIYLITGRYPASPPPGGSTPPAARSFNYTLTFEVFQ